MRLKEISVLTGKELCYCPYHRRLSVSDSKNTGSQRQPGLRDSAGGLKEAGKDPSLFTEMKGPLLSQHHPENEERGKSAAQCPFSLFGLKEFLPNPQGAHAGTKAGSVPCLIRWVWAHVTLQTENFTRMSFTVCLSSMSIKMFLKRDKVKPHTNTFPVRNASHLFPLVPPGETRGVPSEQVGPEDTGSQKAGLPQVGQAGVVPQSSAKAFAPSSPI